MIALAVYSGSDFKIALIKIDGLEISLQQSFDVEGEVTCLAIGKFGGKKTVLAGLYQDKDPILAIYPTELEQEAPATPILLRLVASTYITNIWT